MPKKVECPSRTTAHALCHMGTQADASCSSVTTEVEESNRGDADVLKDGAQVGRQLEERLRL